MYKPGMGDVLRATSEASAIARQFHIETETSESDEFDQFEDGLGVLILKCGSLRILCGLGARYFVIESESETRVELDAIGLVHKVTTELVRQGWQEL